MKEKKKDSDITERKRLEEALRASQQIVEGIINAIPVRVFWKDENLVYLGCNAVFARDAGFADPKDIIGKDDYQMGWRDQAELYRGDDRQVIESGNSKFLIEEPQTTPEGNTITLLTSKIPLRSSEGKIIGVLGTYMDITERKRAESQREAALEALRESEKKYRLLIETANESIVVAQDGLLKFVNPVSLVLLGGYSEQELLDKPFPEFIHPDDRSMVVENYRRRIANEAAQPRYAFRVVARDGIVKWVEINAALIEWQGKPATLNFLTEITERKRAEEEIGRKSKELQEKNDELNRITYAVSHDLRSPLVTIQTFQEHLGRDIKSQDAAQIEKDLGYIRNAADKMGRLLDEIRRFSRVGRIINPSEEASLQVIVKEALDLVAGRITARAVRIDLTEEPVVLYGDRTRLVEVFQNLVDNAAKFMGDQPAPRIEIGVEQAGEELVLHVRDNGIGIGPEVQPLVFGLFHKLDPGSEGDGLGLALVKRIVELHGGRIWVESESPGKGATFRFTLAKTKRAAIRRNLP
jgi:PAS domain S-box-containing protein